MTELKRIFLLILILVFAAFTVGGVAFTFLYNTAFEEEKDRLVETAKSQARLIEAVARFDKKFSEKDNPEGAAAATLSQLVDAHSQYDGFGKTGEFTLARREGDMVVFLLSHRHSRLDKPEAISIQGNRAEPMKQALAGLSGWMVGLDYRGVMVLAAHEPVAVLDMGIVAKIDLSEIRSPFLRAGGIVALICLVIVSICAVPLLGVLNPLLRRIKEGESRFRDFAESSSDWFWEQDEKFRFTYLQAASEHSFHAREIAAIGKTRWELMNINPEEDGRWRRHIEDHMAGRRFRDFRYQVHDTDGNEHIFSVSGKPVFNPEGKVRGYRGTVSDVTELMQSLGANERFFLALNHISEGLALWDAESKLVLNNEAIRNSAGSAYSDLWPGMTYRQWLEQHLKHQAIPEAIGREEAWLAERMEYFENPDGGFEVERNGRWYYFRLKKLPDGSTMHSGIDIQEIKEKEEKLRQSQKMEAIGQLTGGIAHDFNNLLSVMIGNAELLENRIVDDEKALNNIAAIIKAVNRGSALTSRLLAFSRKQTLSPLPVTVDGLILGLEEMLQRTLGETVELTTRLDTGIIEALIDPHQFEDALVNLSINARDAMSDGGVLTIRTSATTLDQADAEEYEEVTAGNYIKVEVSDTGSGIPPEVLEKVFEPFFTTKDVGEGSGLGLSMVYGFIKQSKGHITIDSEVGGGTTVNLYLPRSSRLGILEKNVDSLPVITRGSARILLIEDDEDIRMISTTILREQGYEVVEASDGHEAITLLENNLPFDLLFTDVVLPGGMNGVEIAEHISRKQPKIKILFTTGYAENTLTNNGKLAPGPTLIIKPYRRVELLEKIQAILMDAIDVE